MITLIICILLTLRVFGIDANTARLSAAWKQQLTGKGMQTNQHSFSLVVSVDAFLLHPDLRTSARRCLEQDLLKGNTIQLYIHKSFLTWICGTVFYPFMIRALVDFDLQV